ncbi:hypothetical protein BJF87_12930 [Gordonia sp. CNJ-863]|uniref:hypothetical protein n=1 Tax=Gordonia lacunae TaxID=417102 RepID=UPI0009623227|nr:hypothetical protein BJF87_12930 [Gordonia sp. CNJ-863]
MAALVVAAASYLIAFGRGIYTSIERFGEGASTQPYSRAADIELWSLIVFAALVFVIAIPLLGGAEWRPWWSWPRWTRRAPLSPSTYLACVSVFVLSVYASVGSGWLIEVFVEPSSAVDASTTASRPPAAEVLAALRAGFSEEVFVVAVPIAALAMWLRPTGAGPIAALCVLVPMRLAYHVYYELGLAIGMVLWATVSAYMIWRWRDYRLVIAFALTHAAYNICEGYTVAFWVLLGIAAVSVIALAVTHRVRTGRWITMAAPLLVPAPVRA